MRHVLLVEDDVLTGSAVSNFLTSLGFSTLTVGSHQEALQYLDLEFDAIVFDYVADGSISPEKLVEAIKAHASNRNTPLITITGFDYLPGDLDVQGMLTKPFDLWMLYRLICHATKRAQ